MFEALYSSFRNIVSNIGIIGYNEDDIIKRGNNINKNLELTCLFSYPTKDESSYNPVTYEMMFPDGNHKIECPKFFALSLTDEKGIHTFLYCLKLPEKYILHNGKHNKYEINVPLVICIKSEKSDLEPFRQLLISINEIIVFENNNYSINVLNNYKKVELMNIFYFIFSLPQTSPHSLVRLKLNNNLCKVEDEIDFYFSSNCEIPCNKNDTDINLLFLILDQSIVIKVILSLLSENQIVFIASQAYLLHLIIPIFLKLIFPFKWIQTCITLLPKDSIEYLDTPSSFIIGVLSSYITVLEIMEKYPGKIIVDLDTNEIFGEDNLEPFIAPKNSINDENSNNCKKKKKKEKKEKKEKENNIAFNSEGIKQGTNMFIVDGSYIYKYNNENNGMKEKLKFEEKENIIIDTQKSQFLINKTKFFVNRNELKWLRKNLQLVRNPEIFEIENLNYNKKNSKENSQLNDNESIVLPNRSFSYNIQNIFMHFYLNKISDEKSDFMKSFKETNLYLNYANTEKYQNNSGKKIIENIKETSNDQRSIENCFIIEYNNRAFCASLIIDKLNKKRDLIFSTYVADNSHHINDKYNIYNELKTILTDYCSVLGISIELTKNDLFQIRDSKSDEKISTSYNTCFQLNALGNNNFANNYPKRHIKSNKSLLEFTFNQNPNFNLMGIDKSSKNYFKFYGKDGFLYFLNNINEFIKDEEKEIKNIIFKKKIYKQLINIYTNYENIFKNQGEERKEIKNKDFDTSENDLNETDENRISILNINNIKNDINNLNSSEKHSYGSKDINRESQNKLEGLPKVDISRINSMIVIEEKAEENNEQIPESDSKENPIKEKDSLENIILKKMTFKLEENNPDDDINDPFDNIITFLDYENNQENIDIYNINDKCKTQYYLFLAYYLEEISSDKLFLNKFNKDMLNLAGIEININSFILKMYTHAYINSGEKHRDFPYFTFYTFLMNLDMETLEKVGNNLKEENNQQKMNELYEIYDNAYNKKKKIEDKNKKTKKSVDNYNNSQKSPNLGKSSIGSNSIGDESGNSNNSFRKNIHIEPVKGFSSKSILLSRGQNFSKVLKLEEVEESEENDCTKIIVVNSTSLFKPDCKSYSPHILNEFCSLLTNCFPTKDNIKMENVQNILDIVYNKVNIPPLRELLGELKMIKLSSLETENEKLCFWLNAFNYLTLHAIFHLKLNLNKKDAWKNFLSNIKYNIGGYNFSFEDMLYILFKKNIFFPNNEYKPRDYVKKNILNIMKEKQIKEISPFLLYLPNKSFFKPIIYQIGCLDGDIMKRTINFLLCLIKYNENEESIDIDEIVLITDPTFLNKGIKNYKNLINERIYKIIEGKKYKKISVRPMKWELSFDYILKEAYIES